MAPEAGDASCCSCQAKGSSGVLGEQSNSRGSIKPSFDSLIFLPFCGLSVSKGVFNQLQLKLALLRGCAESRAVPGGGTYSVSRSGEMWTEDMRWNKPCWCDTFHCVCIAKMIMTFGFIHLQNKSCQHLALLYTKSSHKQSTISLTVGILWSVGFWVFFFKKRKNNVPDNHDKPYLCFSSIEPMN